jgi:hypothetical protein
VRVEPHGFLSKAIAPSEAARFSGMPVRAVIPESAVLSEN